MTLCFLKAKLCCCSYKVCFLVVSEHFSLSFKRHHLETFEKRKQIPSSLYVFLNLDGMFDAMINIMPE